MAILINEAPVGRSWLEDVGVIRFSGAICLRGVAGLGWAGVRGFVGICVMSPRGIGSSVVVGGGRMR